MFGSHYILNPRARVLWALDRAVGLARERPALAELASRVATAPAKRVLQLVEHPFVLMWSAVLANLTRHEAPVPDPVLHAGLRGLALLLSGDAGPLPVAAELPGGVLVSPGGDGAIVEIDLATGAERSLTAAGPEGLLLVGDNALVRVLMGDNPTPMAACDPDWARQLARGVALLARTSPEQHARVLAHVDAVASFDAAPGLLQSLSAGEWPGFVVLRCMNPPAHIADQLVHETSHQLLDAAFAARPELTAAMRAAPSGYSPFFTQPRPCLKLVHGIVSYLEVLRFWRAILGAKPWDAELAAEAAQRRHDHVETLCREGLRSLLAVAPDAEWPSWHAFLREVSPLVDDVLAQLAPAPPAPAWRERLASLGSNPVEEAELLLAVTGHKVSRLSLPLEQAGALALALAPSRVPLFSRQVLLARVDHLLGTFSNLTEATFEYYKPPPGAIVYCYVGSDPAEVRQAVLADEHNQAGALLGIPECCRAFFAAHWETARERFQGDLAALRIADDGDTSGAAQPRWQANPFAMYFGEGLTWHFPCAFDCAATVEAIDRRRAALHAIAPDLADRLSAAQRRPIVWSPAHGILRANATDGASVDLTDATALEWTAALERLCAGRALDRRDDGTWATRAGEPLSEILGAGARVFNWR